MSGSVRLSQLPAAGSLQPADEFEVNQGGASRKATLAQMLAGATVVADQISDATPAGRTLLKATNAAAQRAALALSNVDNTSDANKPVSTAQQTALNSKANSAHNHPVATQSLVIWHTYTTEGDANVVIVPRPMAQINAALLRVFIGGVLKSNWSFLADPFNPGLSTWIFVGYLIPQGTLIEVADVTGTTDGFMSGNDKFKLEAIEAQATKNASDADLRSRGSHTGAQPASTINDFSEAVDDRVSNLLVAGSNISLTYDDAGNALTISLGNSPSVSGSLSDAKGNVRDLPANNRGAAYTAAIGDTGRVISISAGGVTIPSAVFSEGQALSIYNRSNSSQTITQGSGLTMYQAGTTNTGNRTLAPRGFATIWFEAGNICVISGNIT